jgi:F-type H+-transporting ATPase subunit b
MACETRRKRTTIGSALVLLAVLLWSTPAQLAAQGEPPDTPAPAAGQPAAETHAAEAHAEGGAEAEEHGGGLVDVLARLLNFVILAGTLVYLLRSPLMTYLAERGTQIRSDLSNAAEMKRSAAAQIDEIDRRMKALPGELEALRTQGAREIAAEEGRIRATAAAERERLLEQARRDIDQHAKIAERALLNHAADLAVGLASDRIRRTITDEDQVRLADRYVQQLKS